MTDLPLYSGNQIFRNQPSYTHFNKSYKDDPTDALFLLLNEIDPVHLNQKSHLEDDGGFQNQAIVDPRTKREVEHTKRDHTRGNTIRLFRSVTKSALTKAQHVVCLRVLRAWQNRLPVEEPDLLIWRTTDHKRQKEKQQLLNFLAEYSQAHREDIYAPAKRLVTQYKLLYERRVAQLLEKYPTDIAYNTHTGLPHVSVCKGDGERVDVLNVQLLERSGWIPLWKKEEENDTQSHFNCQRIHFKLEHYFKLYNESISPEKLHFPKEINIRPQHNVDVKDQNDDAEEIKHKIILPLESLLFLLTAGDYIDLPMEMPVEIQEEDEGDRLKHLLFETPLPARNCGWHTHKLVVEQAYAAYLSVAEQTKWLRLEKDAVHLEPPQFKDEIYAISNETLDYQPLTFDEYLQKVASKTQQQKQFEVKRNSAVIGWQLAKQTSVNEITSIYDIFTATTLPPALNAEASQFLGAHSIKLEFKPQFGCELMTKYELLREWWRIRLLSGCISNIAEGRCYRITASNFETQLVEHINLVQLEKRLSEYYHIYMPQLLSNLMEFLRLLLNMPTGKYLLRYNVKFKDKLMLCAPTEEITQNTIYLHALLKVEPSDLAFMTQPHILPIADDLCSQLHFRFKVLPCMFLPALGKTKEGVAKPKRKQSGKKPKFINDRELVLKRVQLMQENRKAAKTAVKTQHKREQKARKRQRLKKLKQQKQAQISEEQELQNEIAEDQKFFGC